MDVPPSRYRVVERGRRLEVIDTGAKGSARRVVGNAPRKPGEAAGTGWLSKQVRFDGTRRFTTHTVYDAKAPRTVTIAPGQVPLTGWLAAGVALALVVLVIVVALAPWALIALAAPLFNPKARARLRAGTTRLIDRLDDDTL